MLPSLSLPPLECCFGTSPIQAEKLRPDRKILGSATLATRAVTSIGPTRDRLHSDRQRSLLQGRRSPRGCAAAGSGAGMRGGEQGVTATAEGASLCVDIDKHPT